MIATIVWSLCVVFAQWVVIFYPGVLVFWLIFHPNIQRWRKMGTRSYWVAAFAWTITAGPMLLFRQVIFSFRWQIPDDWGLWALASVAFVVAAVMLLQAKQQISVRTMIGIPEIDPAKNRQPVLDKGIYSRTRNPIYFAHWLLVLSAALLTNFGANWILFVLDCVVLPLLIRAEERELLARYGPAYATYMLRVPRFFPRLR